VREIGAQAGAADDAQVRSATVTVVSPVSGCAVRVRNDVGVQEIHDGRVVGVQDRETGTC